MCKHNRHNDEEDRTRTKLESLAMFDTIWLPVIDGDFFCFEHMLSIFFLLQNFYQNQTFFGFNLPFHQIILDHLGSPGAGGSVREVSG